MHPVCFFIPRPLRVASALVVAAIATLAAGTCHADQHEAGADASLDSVELRDGTRVTGEYLGGSTSVMRIRVGKAVRSLEIEQVRAIRFGERRGGSSRDAGADGRHVVATGTPIRVRILETMSSIRSRTGQPFRAVLLNDLAAPDQVLAGAGQQIWGRVTLARRDTRRLRDGDLQLELAEVEVGGRARPVKTSQHQLLEAASDGETAAEGEFRIVAGSILEFRLIQPFIIRDRNF